MSMHVYTLAYTHVCTLAYTVAYTAYTHVYIYAYTHVYTIACTHVYTHVYAHFYTHCLILPGLGLVVLRHVTALLVLIHLKLPRRARVRPAPEPLNPIK